jgi:outer membrane protein OmpA-like peptidoglycan-associated protein
MTITRLMAATLAAAFLSAPLPVPAQTAAQPQDVADPFPTFVSDSCGWQPSLVFFATDNVETGPHGQQTLDKAVELFWRDYGFILLVGHVDGDEFERQPQAGLDQRRAEWVRDELERRGVESGRIWLRARGFAHPTVPTGSGVAELQNRRVAIFLSNFGYTCAQGQHRLRVDWLMRNCLGAMAVANETACRQGLETVRRDY